MQREPNLEPIHLKRNSHHSKLMLTESETVSYANNYCSCFMGFRGFFSFTAE